jgi:RsiW-degrading membrane proteinase PrsW (M82 family)
VVGAGAYEGNMGTAFRHKSLILWVVLALLLSLLWRNSQTSNPDSRNKLTESAV